MKTRYHHAKPVPPKPQAGTPAGAPERTDRTRTCPFPRCGAPIGPAVFCCSRCWQNVPRHERGVLADAFADYRDNVISLPALMNLQARVSERLTGVASDAGPVPETHTCRRCAMPVLRVLGVTGRHIFVDQVRNAAEQEKVRLSAEPLLVVIAGRAAVDTGTEGHPKSYARFRNHPCASPVKHDKEEGDE